MSPIEYQLATLVPLGVFAVISGFIVGLAIHPRRGEVNDAQLHAKRPS